jgi:hypothetical protein
MNIITVFEKTTKDVANSYDIIVGTGIIFDKTNKLVLNCTDDVDEKQWSDESLTFDIDGKEVTFYIIEKTSYDTIKDIAEVIRIQEMEHDLNYMKSQEQHGNSCVGCHAEQGNVKVEPCKSCKDYCNYKSNSMLSDCCSAPIRYLDCEDCKKKGVPCPIVICTQCGATIHDHTDEQAAEIQDNVRYDDQHKVIPTDPDTLDNTVAVPASQETICGPLKETFGNPKTLNQQTGCLEPFEYSKLLRLGFSEEYIKNLKKCLDKNTTPVMEEIKIEKQIKESVKILIDYLWSNEMKHFCKSFGVEIQSQDNIQNWINVCENDNNPEKEVMTNHVFYHLMKLKQFYNL